MDRPQEPLDYVAFLLIQNHQVLAEKRKETQQIVPGVLALPGCHIEAGESPEQALRSRHPQGLRHCAYQDSLCLHAAPACPGVPEAALLRGRTLAGRDQLSVRPQPCSGFL